MNTEIQHIVPVLQSGGLIIFPTDTVWCIGCNALNEQAIERMYAIKKRSTNAAVLLMESYVRLMKYVTLVHPKATALIDYHARPLTIIYNEGKDLPQSLLGEKNSIGVRITKDGFCKALIREADMPLAVMTANYAEVPFPPNYAAIDPNFLKEADYVVRYRQEEIEEYTPSTMLKIKKDGELMFLRK